MVRLSTQSSFFSRKLTFGLEIQAVPSKVVTCEGYVASGLAVKVARSIESAHQLDTRVWDSSQSSKSPRRLKSSPKHLRSSSVGILQRRRSPA